MRAKEKSSSFSKSVYVLFTGKNMLKFVFARENSSFKTILSFQREVHLGRLIVFFMKLLPFKTTTN